MSNPHDESRHRPPPPRQGEPPSYHGGPPPPYQGEPAPQHPAPPPWQGPPPAPPHPYPARRDSGFFGALFDLSFDRMVTTSLIKASYALALVILSLIALVMLLFAWSFSVWNKPLAFATLVATPIFWLAGLLTTRMVLEFVINQFKITEHLKAIRERER